MRREELYLADIVDAVAGFLVLQKLMIIGEAAASLPVELCERYPHLPWADIRDFRNRLVHGYFSVDWDIVWETAIGRLPELRKQVAAIREAEFPGSK